MVDAREGRAAAATGNVDRSAVARNDDHAAAGTRFTGAQEMGGHDPIGVARIVDRLAATRIEDPAHGPSQHVRLEPTLGT
jgi:hypothetical protein